MLGGEDDGYDAVHDIWWKSLYLLVVGVGDKLGRTPRGRGWGGEDERREAKEWDIMVEGVGVGGGVKDGGEGWVLLIVEVEDTGAGRGSRW